MCSNIKLIDQNIEWVKGGAGGGGAGGGGAHRFIHKNGEKQEDLKTCYVRSINGRVVKF